SGLYGMLMPNHVMRPYRLEMQTTLPIDEDKDLYAFWKSRLTTQILNLLDQTPGDRVLLNLASKEYSKALDLKLIMKSFPVITVEFKEQKGDVFKVVGMYAKKARGKMVRFILENEVDEVERLKHYQEDGYAFNKDLSSAQTWVFTR
ncbi:MAG: YaaA family protein, partial [Turicibacter sp.]